MLTRKAKKDFEKWIKLKGNDFGSIVEAYPQELIVKFEHLEENLQNALIIDWFDSVGYTIDRNSYDKKMTITNWTDGKERQTVIDCDYLKPFSEWWEAAIIEANRIYNQS